VVVDYLGEPVVGEHGELDASLGGLPLHPGGGQREDLHVYAVPVHVPEPVLYVDVGLHDYVVVAGVVD